MKEPAKTSSGVVGAEAPRKGGASKKGASSRASASDQLSPELLRKMDAWWRAANYLNIGQIYLMANPLLKEPLKPEHIKPRLLGHWGTSPGLNLIYVHLNRLINKYDFDVVYMAGPGHGGPALVANVYLEGTYTEYFPNVTQDEQGMLKLFRQFSTPGGIPSHVSAPTPGSIHEGGELGYVLVHAFGAAFDNPDLNLYCKIVPAARWRVVRRGLPTLHRRARWHTIPSAHRHFTTKNECWRDGLDQ